VKASEGFADLVQRYMTATGVRNRGVKQAGFLVLVGAAMPNVLIETGYVSNRNEEKFLKSDAGQQKIADAIYRAIKQYREEYQKLLREGTGSPQE
jgi:N-acetylmuramoyl-L-alanine amidase